MHDTFLNHKLYEGIVKLCTEHKMTKLWKLTITVHINSHISQESIQEYFVERDNHLIGEWTEIAILKKDIEPLTAVIDQIDGEKSQ